MNKITKKKIVDNMREANKRAQESSETYGVYIDMLSKEIYVETEDEFGDVNDKYHQGHIQIYHVKKVNIDADEYYCYIIGGSEYYTYDEINDKITELAEEEIVYYKEEYDEYRKHH